MLKFPCLVLDHDDTVVQSMKTLSYPFFLYVLELFRPGETMTLEAYIRDCHELGFAQLCRVRFGFTQEEIDKEHGLWMDYVMKNTPAPYPGIGQILTRQKALGGLVCVVSHSSRENILRDYQAHFSVLPDAIYGWERPEHQRKPNPFPLKDIMERFSLAPEEILVVDDMKLAWQMAHPLGVRLAYAGWSDTGVEPVRREMQALSDYSFDSVTDFEGFLFP